MPLPVKAQNDSTPTPYDYQYCYSLWSPNPASLSLLDRDSRWSVTTQQSTTSTIDGGVLLSSPMEEMPTCREVIGKYAIIPARRPSQVADGGGRDGGQTSAKARQHSGCAVIRDLDLVGSTGWIVSGCAVAQDQPPADI
jgi:hypothetical protein